MILSSTSLFVSSIDKDFVIPTNEYSLLRVFMFLLLLNLLRTVYAINATKDIFMRTRKPNNGKLLSKGFWSGFYVESLGEVLSFFERANQIPREN